MRIKNFARNAVYSFVFQLIVFLFGFIAPNLIISTYGSSVYGLTASINQILNVLQLLQAGALGASIYLLFKPIAENDFSKVSHVLAISRRFYIKTGTIYLIGTFLLAPIAALYIFKTDIDPILMIIAFLILGINGSFSFYFYSKFDIVFAADQKRYIISISGIIEKISYYFMLFFILFMNFPFIFMYLAIFLGTILKTLFLEIQYRRRYSNKIKPVKIDKTDKIQNRNYVMFHSIGTQIVSASPIIILSFVYDLKIVSVFSVYLLIQSIILMVFNTIFYSVGETLGNLFATSDKHKINKVINLLQFGYMTSGAWMLMCTVFLSQSFINIYTSNLSDSNYNYPLLGIMISMYLFVYISSIVYRNIINALGLFKETYFYTIIGALISIILSYILSKFSMPLVLVGPVLFYVISGISQWAILKKMHSWLDFSNFPIRFGFMGVSIGFFAFASRLLPITTSIWYVWIINAFIIAAIAGFIVLLFILCFERSSFKLGYIYIKHVFHRKR